MTVHVYNHSNIIIITATRIGELLWCSYNNMATTILILVGYTTFLPSNQIFGQISDLLTKLCMQVKKVISAVHSLPGLSSIILI